MVWNYQNADCSLKKLNLVCYLLKFSAHFRSLEMGAVAAVCLRVDHDHEPCKNGWSDRDVVRWAELALARDTVY